LMIWPWGTEPDNYMPVEFWLLYLSWQILLSLTSNCLYPYFTPQWQYFFLRNHFTSSLQWTYSYTFTYFVPS
jgi:hypothetical protein